VVELKRRAFNPQRVGAIDVCVCARRREEGYSANYSQLGQVDKKGQRGTREGEPVVDLPGLVKVHGVAVRVRCALCRRRIYAQAGCRLKVDGTAFLRMHRGGNIGSHDVADELRVQWPETTHKKPRDIALGKR
jgi:hypothetical protein